MLLYDAGTSQRLIRGGYIAMRCNSGGLVEGRNKVAREFLTHDADWLFIVDSDMGFAPDTLERLLDAADPDERPIMGVLYFAWREVEVDGASGFRCKAAPVIHDWVETSEGQLFMGVNRYPQDTVMRCAGTGCGGLLVHRGVFEKIEANYGPAWYDRIRGDDGRWISEDLSFCVRAGALGFPVHVHTGVKCTHMKTLWVSEEDYQPTEPDDRSAET
jgi:GT2 family glycosyltransferase